LETITEQWQTMTTSLIETIRERVRHIETMPAIPAVFLPLVKFLSNSVEECGDRAVPCQRPGAVPQV
jgi:hypothetical protein